MTTAALSKWEVREWLVTRIANVLQIAQDEVSPRAAFSELGLSSVQAVELAAALEDWAGCQVPVTVVYEYPTIEDAAEYVLTQLS